MGMIQEFKEFATRGNVTEFIVGVMVGGAFGKVTSSLVHDVIMPPVGLLLGNMDFSKLSIVLREKSFDKPAVLLKYGTFINHCLDFLIVAFVVFLTIRWLNRLRGKELLDQETDCRFCKMTIKAKATRCPHCTSKLKG